MRTEDEIIEIIAHVVERHCTAYARQKTHSPNEIPMWETSFVTIYCTIRNTRSQVRLM